MPTAPATTPAITQATTTHLTIAGRRFQRVPGILACGAFCIACRKPNSGPGFVYTRRGMAHATCVR